MNNKKIGVLIAEDLDVLRNHFIKMVSEQPDMVVLGASSSGSKIVELCNQYPVDVVLMDIEMDHKLDGIEAAHRILEQHPTTKIVFLTVHEDNETVFEAFEAGAVDYVLKSFPSEEITESIRNAYKESSYIRPVIAQKIRNEFSRIRKNETSFLYAMNIISQLTAAEKDIIRLLMLGKRVSEIAELRTVEEVTIKSQITILLKKFEKRRTKEIVHMIKQLRIEHYFII
jgi:DNA-binding NarL/FixJ family response regulator